MALKHCANNWSKIQTFVLYFLFVYFCEVCESTDRPRHYPRANDHLSSSRIVIKSVGRP